MKFSLKIAFLVIAALAILFAQYPFVECVERIEKVSQHGKSSITQITERYTLTRRFTAVLGAEIVACIAWWYWRRWQTAAQRNLDSG